MREMRKIDPPRVRERQEVQTNGELDEAGTIHCSEAETMNEEEVDDCLESSRLETKKEEIEIFHGSQSNIQKSHLCAIW